MLNKHVFILFISFFMLSLFLSGCKTGNESQSSQKSRVTSTNQEFLEGTHRVYYYSFSENYNKNLYVWSAPEDKALWVAKDWPGFSSFRNGGTEIIDGVTFKYISFNVPEEYAATGVMNYIINDRTGTQTADLVWPNSDEITEIYLIEGSEDRPLIKAEDAVANAVNDISTAVFDESSIINFTLKTKYDEEVIEIFENDKLIESSVDIRKGRTTGKVILKDFNFNSKSEYFISFNQREKRLVGASGKFIDSEESGLTPDFNSKLGAVLQGRNATFNVWSPFATAVKVNYYNKWDQNANEPTASYDLKKTNGGVWTGTFPGSSGQLYQYELHFDDVMKRALDPYAKSMGSFSSSHSADKIGKGALIDVSAHGRVTRYHNWSGKREDAIIYEIHVRDFTVDPSIEKNLTKPFGTYRAFIDKLDHIKNLGVTHIQLLPVLAYYNKDESKRSQREMMYRVNGNNYNWGYDPHNYFSPEGMYSENPTDPAARVRELKELIEAIHNNGMGVLLDVVYNHTASTTAFENLVPDYYYRTGRNKSGCGNDTASERKMMRKIIVDSVEFWVEEYKVDGFRFDLMGLNDRISIEMAYDAAKKHNPNTIFIGEGWKQNTDLRVEGGWADQSSLKNTDVYGVFSDGIRNILKGGGFNEGAPAFLTNTPQNLNNIFQYVVGKKVSGSDLTLRPGDAVQYIAAHDGLTWYDTVAYSMKTTDQDEIYKRLKLGNLFVLTSQGVAFIHAGQEYGRTKEYEGNERNEIEIDRKNNKKYVRNSYDASDRINMIDWTRVNSLNGNKLYNYTRGLVNLRKSTDAFRLGKEAFSSVTRISADDENNRDLVFGMKKQASNGDVYYVLVNADNKERTFSSSDFIDLKCLVDGEIAGTDVINSPNGVTIENGRVILQPLTGTILKK